jgi:uncharacterized membrane protein
MKRLLLIFLSVIIFASCDSGRKEVSESDTNKFIPGPELKKDPAPDTTSFTALGNEPFWSVDISPSENRVVLKDMSIEQTFDFEYSRPVRNASDYLYETTNDKGEKIKITIKEEACSDGMSDRRYHYSSEVIINGRTLKGCAFKKGEKFPDPV